MSENKHTDDLLNVDKGDSVTIITTKDRRFAEVTCIDRIIRSADELNNKVRQTNMWIFDVGDDDLTVSIVDGLRSSPDDPEFPVHNEANIGNVTTYDSWESVGYFESVKIHGPIMES